MSKKPSAPQPDPTSPTSLPLFRATQAARPTSRNLAGATPGAKTATKPPKKGGGKVRGARAAPPSQLPAPDPAPAVVTALGAGPAQATEFDGYLSGTNWSLVKSIRDAVSERIRKDLGDDELAAGLNRGKHEGLTRVWIEEELGAYNTRLARSGNPTLNSVQRTDITEGVIDAIFGLGRIEALLRLKGLEDIAVRGCDQVSLLFADGRRVKGPPVADTDEELIADIRHLATINPSGERQFSPAHPQLDLSLPNGDRLSASAWFTARPTLTIRRHTLLDIDLSTLLTLGAIDEGLRQLLKCCMQAGISGVVSGLPKTGKTTLIRAMLNELDDMVPLATIETEYELGLHRMPERHHNVWPTQTVQGGEGGAGEMTARQLLRAALRQTVDRIVVGEVRGDEVLDMVDAMSAGKGSLSTVHTRSPRAAVDRLATMATRAGANVTVETAYRVIGDAIDLIVQLSVIDETPIGGRRHRFVSHVDALRLGGDSPTGVEHHELYTPGPDGRAIPTGLVPEWIGEIEVYGYDRGWLQQRGGGWSGPLDLIRPPQTGRAS